MECKKELETKIKFTVTEEEAKWLRNLVQNPMEISTTPGKESEFNLKMRETFWFSISTALEQ